MLTIYGYCPWQPWLLRMRWPVLRGVWWRQVGVSYTDFSFSIPSRWYFMFLGPFSKSKRWWSLCSCHASFIFGITTCFGFPRHLPYLFFRFVLDPPATFLTGSLLQVILFPLPCLYNHLTGFPVLLWDDGYFLYIYA